MNVDTFMERMMNDKEIEALGDWARQSFREYSKRRLSDAEIDDEVGELLSKLFSDSQKLAKIKNPRAYIRRAVRNRVINVLEKRKRQRTDQLEDEAAAMAEAVAPEFESAEDSILHLLERKYPDRYDFILKSVKLIDLLYRVSLSRDNPNVSMLLCLDRAMNALSEAKHKIDYMMFRTGSDNFGVHKFRRRWGVNISRWLQDEIEALWLGGKSIKELPRLGPFPAFVIDALPKLKADPIMLLLRVLYKTFKIGSGKYGARDMIEKIILELKLKGAARIPRETDIFRSVGKSTNFETLRKKIYRKSADPFYDKIAGWICEVYNTTK